MQNARCKKSHDDYLANENVSTSLSFVVADLVCD
jgi:hypothetical protein